LVGAILDDRGTPLDLLDDEWTPITLEDKLVAGLVGEALSLDPAGGVWLSMHGSVHYIEWVR
jgi:hypothetical protein